MTRRKLTIGERRSQFVRPLATPRHGQAARRSFVRLTLGLALVIGLVVLGRWLVTEDRFTIRRVKAGPYSFTQKARLDSVLATAIGENIWSFRSGKLTDRLRKLPWVQDARVVRKLPGSLAVEMWEWRPMLLVADEPRAGGTSPWALLADGTVLEFPDHLPPPALPVLVGVAVERDTTRGGWRLAPAHGESVLELVTAIAQTGLEAAHPVDFIIAREDGFVLDVGSGDGRLLLGQGDFAARLRLYLGTRDRAAPGSVVDLRYRERVGVSLLATAG